MVSDTDARPRNHGLPALVAGVVGVVLVAAAAPRVVAALLSLGSQQTVWDVRHELAVEPARLGQGAADLGLAAQWFAEGEMETERGYLLLRRAQFGSDPALRDFLYRQARSAIASGLALAPAQPGAWARLAYLRQYEGNAAAAAKAYRMSLLTGAVMPPLMPSRLELGLRLRPDFDAETRELLSRQVRLTWIIAPDAIARLSADSSHGGFIRDALAGLSAAQMEDYQRLNKR
ncbi:conserved hypothetical protein [Candidatus Terasakiella magnetica]|nr:conserved hypothetical protein [Candidatus Terasakiella magnetica]